MYARSKIAAYRKVQVHTSQSSKILLMLYDGAIRLLTQAREAMQVKNFAEKGGCITKAYAIILELQMTLNPKHSEELCTNLSSLYQFMMDRLTQANIDNNPAEIDRVLDLLTTLREGWQEAATKQGESEQSNAPQT